jgi:hypothetical protein
LIVVPASFMHRYLMQRRPIGGCWNVAAARASDVIDKNIDHCPAG